MRALDQGSDETQAGGEWASKLADEALAWRGRRGQTDIARGSIQVVRLPKRNRSAISNRAHPAS